jgi:uncharacterized repeat protein (TIGR03803 family)
MFLRKILCIFAILISPCAADEGWSVTALHGFEKPGANSVAALTRHSDGRFYGVASSGGANGDGTIFRIGGGKTETLHHFAAIQGSAPASALVSANDGFLYGTTSSGGTGGFGTLFRYDPGNGSFSKLVDFSGGAQGSVPDALVLETDGNLYGVTRSGGLSGHGTIFKCSLSGTLTTLHSFNGTQGSDPCGPLVFSNGNFYGVCRSGGASDNGEAFRISPAGLFSPLFSFSGSGGIRPGATPRSGLMLHSSGMLVGTTEYGGSSGFGTAFTLTTAAVPAYATLRHFSDPGGSQPVGSLSEGNDGNLYGCAAAGGTNGLGCLYRLSLTGVHSVLHHFAGVNGATPQSGLVKDPSGVFHGITSAGGPGDFGSAFQITTAGAFTLAANLSPADGFMPSGAPVTDGTGRWFFPVARGGSGGNGAIGSWDTVTAKLSTHSLDATVGDTPDGALTMLNGVFYGVCARGGASARGTAFTFDPASGAALLASHSTTVGSLPDGPLLASPGGLFGLAREGGALARGSLYSLSTSGIQTRILSFTSATGVTPGRSPLGPAVLASNQSFYGAYAGDGVTDHGGIFKVSAVGTYSQIAAFLASGPRDPRGGLVAASDGFIYGTCSNGGAFAAGAVIRINPGTDTWDVVASFAPSAASSPVGSLLAAADGFLYGLTATGHAFRYKQSSGLEILAHLGSGGLAADESNLTHAGGLALLPNGSLLAAIPGGGSGGGGFLANLAPPISLTSWKLSFLGDANAPDLGDPDHDSLPNLVEYALATNPIVADPALPFEYVNGRLEILINRDPARSDVTIVLEATSDLSGLWTPLATSVLGQPFTGIGLISGDNSTPGIKSILLSDTLAISGEPRRFLRLRVNR